MSLIIQLPGVELSNTRGAQFMITNVEGLVDSTDPKLDDEERENGHGDFGQADIWQQARFVTVEGVFFNRDETEFFTGPSSLKALSSKHFEAVFHTPAGVLRAQMLLASKVSWSPLGHEAAEFEFTLKSDDPRLYGPLQVATTGVPTTGVGIADPVLDPVQEGEEGNLGRVQVRNNGTAPSSPKVIIHGGLSEGFDLLCIEHALVVTVTRPIPDGSFVVVDHAAGQVWLDGESLLPSTYVPSAEWFQVEPGESCTIQWRPRGATTGTPSMTVEFSEASW